MRQTQRLSITAAALLAGTLFAAAQGTQAPSPGGGMDRAAPGQNRAQEQIEGQREQGNSPSQKRQTQGQGQRDRGQAPIEGQQREQTQPQQGQQRDPAQQQQRQRSAAQQGEGSGKVTFTTEQRTKIRQTVIQGSNAPRVNNVSFSINVGTVVPRSTRVVAVPATLVEIRPAWRGYLYFIVGERLIIVEPKTYRIAAVVVV